VTEGPHPLLTQAAKDFTVAIRARKIGAAALQITQKTEAANACYNRYSSYDNRSLRAHQNFMQFLDDLSHTRSKCLTPFADGYVGDAGGLGESAAFAPCRFWKYSAGLRKTP
jgi:hypothetical protein